jgi:urease accessory protein
MIDTQQRPYSDAPEVDFSHLPELKPYLSEPPAMYVGAPGKCGYLNLTFALDGDGKSILRDLDRRAPLIVQQELYFDRHAPQMPCVYILSSGGPNVDGDRFTQNITVCAGAQAHVATGAATKLASMSHNYSGMSQTFTLEPDAYLEMLPEPVIPCRHARFVCDTTLCVHPTATVVYAEIYACGRQYYGNGEVFAYDLLSLHTRGTSHDGTMLFNEKMVVSPPMFDVRTLGTMSRYTVFANVIVMTPPAHADAIFEATPAYMGKDTAVGISRLPNKAGLIYKVLTHKTAHAKAKVREFCSAVRTQVKGIPLPDDFPWR